MAFFILEQIERAGTNLKGVRRLVIEADSESAARKHANGFAGDPDDGSGQAWDTDHATSLQLTASQAVDWRDWRFRAIVSPFPKGQPDIVDVSYTALPGDSLDAAMNALAAKCNTHPLLNGASWDGPSKILRVCGSESNLGGHYVATYAYPPGGGSTDASVALGQVAGGGGEPFMSDPVEDNIGLGVTLIPKIVKVLP